MTTKTTTEDHTTIEPPERGWRRESSHEVITRFADKAPYHMTDSDQLPLLLQIMCKELQALSNEVVVLQNEAEMLRDRLAKEVRTERLVVVHPDDGRELIYTNVLADSVAIVVDWQPDDEESAHASLISGEELGGEAALSLGAGGNVAASLMVVTHANEDGSATTTSDLFVSTAVYPRTAGGKLSGAETASVDVRVGHDGLSTKRFIRGMVNE